jgi:hypothetical protein
MQCSIARDIKRSQIIGVAVNSGQCCAVLAVQCSHLRVTIAIELSHLWVIIAIDSSQLALICQREFCQFVAITAQVVQVGHARDGAQVGQGAIVAVEFLDGRAASKICDIS